MHNKLQGSHSRQLFRVVQDLRSGVAESLQADAVFDRQFKSVDLFLERKKVFFGLHLYTELRTRIVFKTLGGVA